LSGRDATSFTPQSASCCAICFVTSVAPALIGNAPYCRDRVFFAARKARHTFSGLIGSVMSRTPRCHSASITALPIAAGAPIVPLSLPPFTPRGLLGAGGG